MPEDVLSRRGRRLACVTAGGLRGRRGDDDLFIEGWQNGVLLNQYKVMDRGGIGNDQHLQTEPTMGLTILLQVFQRISQRNIVLFEKSVDFQACFIPQ
jgi:hypothetical protein